MLRRIRPGIGRGRRANRDMNELIEPGMRVRHAGRPDWGTGQVQSVDGDRITVNFEDAGKVLIRAGHVVLEIVDEPGRRR